MSALQPNYTPLNKESREIRLLRISKRETYSKNEDSGRTICGSFSIVSLNEHPTYEALSYVWGDPHKSETISIDDQSVAVTPNLFEALEELQSADQERTLWVDAVCINQTDDEERTHQVSQMRHIYECAASVAIYLGPVWEGCGDALKFFEKSAQDADVHYTDENSPHIEVNGKTLGGSEKLRSYIRQFFDLAWWKRVWTVQEFVLAKKTVFQCGPYNITEEVLIQSFHHVRVHTRSCCNRTALGSRDPLSGLSNWDVYNRMDYLRQMRSYQQTFTFLRTLASFRVRHSYDPRDKIFGLLGLAVEDWASCIIPDYTRSTEDVYRAIVVAYVQGTGNLEFLRYCYGNRTSGLKIPSFVPDWTAWVDDNLNSNHTNRGASWIFDASNGALAEMIFTKSHQATFKGVIYDEVTRIGPSAPAGRISAVELQSWREFAGVEHAGPKTIEDLTDADIEFGATLCGGMGLDWKDGDGFMRRATVEQDWPSFNKWEAWVESGYDMSTFDPDVANFTVPHVTVSLDRRVVGTSNGHLAFVPNETREGDVIAILAGGKSPYVLHPSKVNEANLESSTVYEFVGDAYVFGVMDGEVWPEDESDLSHIKME